MDTDAENLRKNDHSGHQSDQANLQHLLNPPDQASLQSLFSNLTNHNPATVDATLKKLMTADSTLKNLVQTEAWKTQELLQSSFDQQFAYLVAILVMVVLILLAILVLILKSKNP